MFGCEIRHAEWKTNRHPAMAWLWSVCKGLRAPRPRCFSPYGHAREPGHFRRRLTGSDGVRGDECFSTDLKCHLILLAILSDDGLPSRQHNYPNSLRARVLTGY